MSGARLATAAPVAGLRVPRSAATPPSAGDRSACHCRWPRPAVYTIAGRAEPVVVLGLAGDEVRVIRADGTIGRVAEHRVRLEAEAAQRRNLP